MALAIPPPPPNDRKRVKVYELKENDWYDRGTGFCAGQILDDEARILVESEDQPNRMLLETIISRDDGYQKQQDTLIVWTDVNGVDMALSFQEAEGCAAIWEFVRHCQQQLMSMAGHDDSLSDDAFESVSHSVCLPQPELGNLSEVEQVLRSSSTTQIGRDALSKFIIRDDYVMKLLPLVSIAEDLESLPDLHRLCTIMKSLILLNDNAIIELVVSDNVISSVVGALEYDPEFPTHKANHRQYLNDRTRFKEVVPIKDPLILRKIRHTWRLQYLKDVVLARILDDPTFSVLNSLIFFNQVDIVQHLQENAAFLNELFGLFSLGITDTARKDDAVRFIHQCASIAKTIQAPARGNFFANMIHHGLFAVISYAIGHPNPPMRTTGIDILVILLDHDPIMMRGHMLKALAERQAPLTDTLIRLLHVDPDLGVKNQLTDALKVLLDPGIPLQELINRIGPEFVAKLRGPNSLLDPSIAQYFEDSARKLFLPLKQLESKGNLNNLPFQEVALYSHLVDILTFFVRQHTGRARGFLHDEILAPRVAQLLTAPQKHLKLVALKFCRTLIACQDTFYSHQLTQNNILELILNIVYESMPRDNLLNSACLELFEYVKRENLKPIIVHLVEKYRDKLKSITYVDTFQNIILRYDQMQGYGALPDGTLWSQDESTASTTSPPRNMIMGGQRWHGVRGMDAAEEEYFDASDEEDDEEGKQHAVVQNGATKTTTARPLVDYPDDDEEEEDEVMFNHENNTAPPATEPDSSPQSLTLATQRYAEKRRREQDDDDDELVKLSSQTKRRSASVSSVGSMGSMSGMAVRKGGIFGTASTSTSPENKSVDEGDGDSVSSTGADNAEPAPAVGRASPTTESTDSATTTTPKKISIKFSSNVRQGIKLKLKSPTSRNGNGNGNGAVTSTTTTTTEEETQTSNNSNSATTLEHTQPHGETSSSDAGGSGGAG